MDLLFMMAYWHGMAKLRLHSEPTLETMDRLTTSLGDKFRAFEKHTCSAFVTYELKKEATARERRQSKSAKKTRHLEMPFKSIWDFQGVSQET
jgi:hypothetical protein